MEVPGLYITSREHQSSRPQAQGPMFPSKESPSLPAQGTDKGNGKTEGAGSSPMENGELKIKRKQGLTAGLHFLLGNGSTSSGKSTRGSSQDSAENAARAQDDLRNGPAGSGPFLERGGVQAAVPWKLVVELPISVSPLQPTCWRERPVGAVGGGPLSP
ncbi:hypothetical protein B7463_g7434, partial [Scytalidium lignicola]